MNLDDRATAREACSATEDADREVLRWHEECGMKLEMPGTSQCQDDLEEGGGELDPLVLLQAYASGIFPMAMDDGTIGWFCPDPRGILPIEGLRVSRSLRARVRRQEFEIRVDTAFRKVMLACADRPTTWIDDRILRSYGILHSIGVAHSVEAWRDGELVGGLYGVALRGVFCGESMFSRATDASKVCLVHLTERLQAGGYVLHDTQWCTPHLETLGGKKVPRRVYLAQLSKALDTDACWDAS